jgi:hypothetical protein
VPVRRAVIAIVLALASAPVAGVTEVMTERDIAQALNVANGSESSRARFHAAYRLPIDDALVEHLEVVTEFRRFVLAAEEQAKAGNWMMARGGYDTKGRTIKDLLRARNGQVAIRARLRLHPHNSYITLPAFDMLLGEPTLVGIDAVRTPHVTLASGQPGTRDLIYGATIDTFYDATQIADRVLPLRLVFEGKEVARLSVDFSKIQ